jgi:hypothetical protein
VAVNLGWVNATPPGSHVRGGNGYDVSRKTENMDDVELINESSQSSDGLCSRGARTDRQCYVGVQNCGRSTICENRL